MLAGGQERQAGDWLGSGRREIKKLMMMLSLGVVFTIRFHCCYIWVRGIDLLLIILFYFATFLGSPYRNYARTMAPSLSYTGGSPGEF